MPTARNRWVIAVVPVAVIAVALFFRDQQPSQSVTASATPTRVLPTRADGEDAEGEDQAVRQLTMGDVLEMARSARQHLAVTLDDYTARFVKQEMDQNGDIGPETEMMIKVQTRLRSDAEDAPLRVYLRFTAPESINGREVLWAEDLNDGKMAVHEVGLLFSLKTLWLDPDGVIAMQGQRYPISEIGLVRLVEQLIERGEKDRDNPDVSVTLTEGHPFDDLTTQFIRVQRSRPSGEPDDFSLAEIVIDPTRQLILSFRSFGWPDQEGAQPPVLESYTYHDVKTNVGLTDADFDTKNPEYSFPAF